MVDFLTIPFIETPIQNLEGKYEDGKQQKMLWEGMSSVFYVSETIGNIF